MSRSITFPKSNKQMVSRWQGRGRRNRWARRWVIRYLSGRERRSNSTMSMMINLKRTRERIWRERYIGKWQYFKNGKRFRGWEEWRVLKEGDINGEKIMMSVRGITTITLLKSRVSQENAFRSLGGELILSKCESRNKTSTAKDMRRKEIKRLGRKKEGMRDLVM